MFDCLGPTATSAARWELDPLDKINRRLAGFWPILDGRSARDISGRGRHGTFSAAVAMRAAKWGKAPGFITAGGGNAALGPIITIGSAFSLSFWAMGDNASGTGSITQPFSTDNVFNTSRITFSWDHSSGSYNQGWNGYGGGSYPVVKYTTALAANTPYLLGFTYDGNNLAIFLNGRQEGSVAIGALAAASGALAFGGTPGNTKYWAGRAGLLRWVDRIWTPDEWRTLHREPWAGMVDPAAHLFFAFKATATGTAYTDALADSLTAADAMGASLAALGAVSDALTGADAIAASLAASASLSDAATSADALAVVLGAAATLAEALTAADALANGMAMAATLADAATAAEAVAGGMLVAATTADSATAAESALASLTLPAALADALAAQDSLAAVLAALAAIADDAAALDALAQALAMSGTLADVLTAADAILASSGVVANVASVSIAWTPTLRRATWAGEARRIPWAGPARRVTWRKE